MAEPSDGVTSHYEAVDLMRRLAELYDAARADERGLDALTLIAAKDAVEQLDLLMIAVRGHRFDSQHIHDRGVYPRIRAADQALYEAAGLDRVAETQPECLCFGVAGRRVPPSGRPCPRHGDQADQAADRDGPGRCEAHGTVLAQRFEIDDAQMRPTGRYRCVKCSEGERR